MAGGRDNRPSMGSREDKLPRKVDARRHNMGTIQPLQWLGSSRRVPVPNGSTDLEKPAEEEVSDIKSQSHNRG